jgi:endonuclease G
MPASSLARAAFFALGAAVGGGAVAAFNASNKKEAPSSPPAITARSKAVVEVGATGDPRFSAGAATAAGLVLKYGNPGKHAMASLWITLSLSGIVVAAGPISDQLARRAYAAAYDRRLRHPAWVGVGSLSLSPTPADEGDAYNYFSKF